MMGATAFLVAAMKTPSAELAAIVADQKRLESAARQHGIPVGWAKFWIREELNRNDRRG